MGATTLRADRLDARGTSWRIEVTPPWSRYGRGVP
jgi:hypothetical protein